MKLDLTNQTDALVVDTTGDGNGALGGGNDQITVGSGANSSYSTGRGNDTIIGFVSGDTVDGGAGTDTISIVSARDALAISNAGDAQIANNVEIISAANATAGVTLNLSNQTEGFTSINGSAFADVITGSGNNNNRIYSGAGNDTINGYSSSATVDGGAGTDTIKVSTVADASNVSNTTTAKLLNIEVLDFSSVNAGVTVRMANMANSSTFKYIGSGFADTLAAHNTATSNTGDTLVGGAGNDSLSGGTGHDTFAFEATAAGNGLDTITGFTKTGTAFDTLQVSSFLTALNGTNLYLTGSAFTNVAATAYDQHVVLINSTADLATTNGFNSVFGAGAGHLALFTSDAQKAVLIEGTTANNSTDKMYYVTHDNTGTHVTQVASLVGVGQFAAATDVHVA
jgi:Ca2+-binding RTX toxin-like protein